MQPILWWLILNHLIDKKVEFFIATEDNFGRELKGILIASGSKCNLIEGCTDSLILKLIPTFDEEDLKNLHMEDVKEFLNNIKNVKSSDLDNKKWQKILYNEYMRYKEVLLSAPKC